jgi:4-hydroxybenzoate polyprenyltransferase
MLVYLQLLRVRQWIKNLFVFTGVFFAALFTIESIIQAVLVFVSFCLASSFVYVVNDLRDAPKDRLHPVKKLRPIAIGIVSEKEAKSVLFVLLVLLFVSFLAIPLLASFIVLFYVGFNFLYTYYLKHVVLLDVFSISLSFILRVLAGTIGLGIEASRWLVVTVIALSLFLSFAKRFNEKEIVGKKHRAVLSLYSREYLSAVMVVCATLSIGFYSLYVIGESYSLWPVLTIPVVLFGFCRYFLLTHVLKQGGDPTMSLVKDRYLFFVANLWVVLLVVGMVV